MPRNPVTPPKMARNMFSGKWLLMPNSFNASCIITVISILEDPMVDVRDAPILLKPVEYDNEPINGSNENNKKIIILNINGSLSKDTSFDGNTAWSAPYDNPAIIKPTRIKPEVNIDAPATSIDEYLKVSLVRKSTPTAKPKAERIASTSPKLIIIADNDDDPATVVDDAILLVSVLSVRPRWVSLTTAIQNPSSAILMPMKWYLLSLSFRNTRAKSTMMTISSGPAIRTSFDAPIRLIESYHVKIPNESDKDARIKFFHDLMKRIGIFLLLYKNDAASNNIIPAKVILMAERMIGEIWRNEEFVKYSIIIDSMEIVIAYTNTTQDLRINNVKNNRIRLQVRCNIRSP
jgi:hypothetical protein